MPELSDAPNMLMTAPQAILIIGGLLNIVISALAGFLVLWIRARDPKRPMSRYAAVTHTSAITNGVLLLGLSVAIPHTGFIGPINIAIACAEVLATLLSTVRNVISWRRGFNDAIAEGSDLGLRTRGLVNMIHLFDSAAILYGVVRTALGI
jgi:hypothetical protein